MNTAVRILTVAALLLPAGMTFADPLADEVLKFEQLPLDGIIVGDEVYWGHDELSTAYGLHDFGEYGTTFGPGTFMADDFADKISQPVVHVQWWGSYLNNEYQGGVRKFLISFESDIPADATGNFSQPGEPLLTQVVELGPIGSLTPNSGTFTEMPISPGGHPMNEELYVYNAELAIPFEQEADTVYWLKIVALVDPTQEGDIRWGWHDRDYSQFNPTASDNVSTAPFGENLVGILPDGTEVWHFQDDAISGSIMDIYVDPVDPLAVNMFQDPATFVPQNYISTLGGIPILYPGIDGPEGIEEYSKDLAFALYAAIPEPASMVLIGLGTICLLAMRRREYL